MQPHCGLLSMYQKFLFSTVTSLVKRIKKRCRHKCNGYKIKEPAVVATMVMSTQGNCYSAVVIIIVLEILDVKILPLVSIILQ